MSIKSALLISINFIITSQALAFTTIMSCYAKCDRTCWHTKVMWMVVGCAGSIITTNSTFTMPELSTFTDNDGMESSSID